MTLGQDETTTTVSCIPPPPSGPHTHSARKKQQTRTAPPNATTTQPDATPQTARQIKEIQTNATGWIDGIDGGRSWRIMRPTFSKEPLGSDKSYSLGSARLLTRPRRGLACARPKGLLGAIRPEFVSLRLVSEDLWSPTSSLSSLRHSGEMKSELHQVQGGGSPRTS